MKNYLVVVNPRSGKKGLGYLHKLTDVLESKQCQFDVFYTTPNPAEDISCLQKQLIKYSDVVSLGGDGTLNMLSNVLAHSNIPLGIIPCGTGNDFTRNIYKKKHDIMSVVTGDSIMNIDLGRCNDRYFMNVLGIGYDAMMAETALNKEKGLFAPLFYLINALKYLPFYREKTVHINSNTLTRISPTFMAVFGNGAFFGNGMNITPKASVNDGLLDCCWVGEIGFLQRCYYLVKIFKGTHLYAHCIEYFQDSEFHILSENHPLEADGEFIGYSPASIYVEKNALKLKIL